MKPFQLALWEAAIPSRVPDDERLIAMWLHGKADNTRDAYFRDMLAFTAFVDKPLPDVALADLQAYSESLSVYQSSTRARKLSSIKSLLTFGYRLGYLRYNIGAVVRPPKIKDTLSERILEEDDVRQVINAEPDTRNRLILEMLYVGGVRVSELCGLTWSDVRKRDESFQITVFGKGGRTRAILLPAPLSRRLIAFRGRAGEKDPVFPSSSGGALHRSQVFRIVRAAARRSGLKAPVSPHWFRHAHASHALDRGAPTHLVQQTLGHASLATTGRYTHARPKDSSALYVSQETYCQ